MRGAFCSSRKQPLVSLLLALSRGAGGCGATPRSCLWRGLCLRLEQKHTLIMYAQPHTAGSLMPAPVSNSPLCLFCWPCPWGAGGVWGDAQELPLEGDSVDAVTMGYGLRNVTDMDLALRRDTPDTQAW